MQGYYYTISSLPHLSFTASPPPLSTSLTFLPLCEIELDRTDMTILRSISLQPPAPQPSSTPPLIERWYNWERMLRQGLAKRRAAKLNRKYHLPQPYTSSFFNTICQQAMALESPSEAENLLDQARWQLLTELASEHNFGLPTLGVYFLKLQLLEHRTHFNQHTGQQLRQKILNQITLPERPVQ